MPGYFPNLSKCSKTAAASENTHSLHVVPTSMVGLRIRGLQTGRPVGKPGPWLDTVTGEPRGVQAAGDTGHGETSWGIKPQVTLRDILKARGGVDSSGKGLADKGEYQKIHLFLRCLG